MGRFPPPPDTECEILYGWSNAAIICVQDPTPSDVCGHVPKTIYIIIYEGSACLEFPYNACSHIISLSPKLAFDPCRTIPYPCNTVPYPRILIILLYAEEWVFHDFFLFLFYSQSSFTRFYTVNTGFSRFDLSRIILCATQSQSDLWDLRRFFTHSRSYFCIPNIV